MNIERGSVALAVVFLIALIGVGVVVFGAQQRTIREQSGLIADIRTRVDDPAVPSLPVVTSTPPVELIPLAPVVTSTILSAPVVAPSDRLVSPDGFWRLVYRKIGNDESYQGNRRVELTDTVTHVFSVQYLDQPTVRELWRTTEKVDRDQDSPGTNVWSLIGWSRTGAKVYIASTPIIGGLGGNYPDAESGARTLIELDAKSGDRKTVLDLTDGKWNLQSGIYTQASLLQKDLLLYAAFDGSGASRSQKLYLSDFAVKNVQLVMTLAKGGISRVSLSDDLKMVLITTYEDSLKSDSGYVYTRWEYNIASKNLSRL